MQVLNSRDVMSPKEVCEFVNDYRNQNISAETLDEGEVQKEREFTTDDVLGVAEGLVNRALDLKSTDNVSVIVVFFSSMK